MSTLITTRRPGSIPFRNPVSSVAQGEGNDHAGRGLDEHAAIKAVVRDFLHLSLHSERRPEFLTGRVAEYSRLLRRVRLTTRLLAEEVSIADLRLDRADACEARVAVTAITRAVAEHPATGRVEYQLDWSGPMWLARVGEAWKIADFFVDGRAALDTIALLDRAQGRADDVSVNWRRSNSSTR